MKASFRCLRVLTLFFVFAFVLASGCGEDSSDSGACSGVADSCLTAGEVRCAAGNGAVQTCTADAAGCLAWATTTTCVETESCTTSGGAPACAGLPCEDECTTEGAVACAEDEIITCTLGADGCLDLVETEDCGASGEFCDDSGATPVCAVACVDECDAVGDTECVDDAVMTCAEDTTAACSSKIRPTARRRCRRATPRAPTPCASAAARATRPASTATKSRSRTSA